MIRRIVVFSIRNRFLLIGVVFLLALAGLAVFPTLPRGLLPRLDVPTLNVFVENPALSADEMETLVLRPLEGRLRGLLGAQAVRSTAQQGLVQVAVTFDWSTSLQDATQRVTAAVGQAQPDFPDGTHPPTIGNPSSSINQVLQYYLEAPPGSAVDLRTLRTVADATVAPALLAIPGVLRVLNVGGEVRTYEVAADPRRLAAYGLSLADVARAVERANAPFSGTIVPEGSREVLVRPGGRLRGIEELRTIVVGERAGRAVLLPEVAEIREGSLLRRSIAMAEGREVVGGTLITQFGADTGPIIARAKQALVEIRPALPPGVRIRTYFDETELVDAAIGSLRDALLVGGLAVVAVIFLLLWDWVTTLLIAIVLPVVVCITFLAMRLFDVGVNVMSLGGIAVALGIMVDSAIVDAENIFRRLQKDRHRDDLETTVEATLEVRRPITYAMLIIVAAFVPIFFLPGIAGRIFGPFGFTVIAAMFVGYAISMTLTPALCYTFLPRRVARGIRQSPLLTPLHRVFDPALERVVAHPWLALGAGLLLAVATFLIVPFIGSEFLPPWDEGLIMVKAQTPPGTGVAETARVAERVSQVIHRAPDVAQAFFWAGRPEASEEPEGANNSEITVTLAPFARRTHSVDAIKAWLRENVGEAPGTRVLLTSPMTERLEESLESGSAGGGPLVVQIFGDDLAVLTDRLQRLAALVRSVPGVAEVREEQTVGLPQLEVRVDPVSAARFGLTRADVGEAVELAMGGRSVTSVFPGARQEIPIVLRVAEDYRNDPERIGELLLAAPNGGRVPLRQVASLVRSEGPHQIARENGQRRVQLGATLEGRDLGSVVEAIRGRAAALDLPRGYRLEFAGSYRSQQQVQNTVLLAFGLSLLFVFIVLHMAFDSGRQAALVMFSIPLALLGGFAALWITNTTLNVSSLIGILAHLGLSVQKAVILIEYANDRVAEGMGARAAAIEAGRVRMRPVLMTALAASLAVVPLVLGLGAGAELQRPLAIVLIGGLLTSTPLVLFLLPALYPWTVGNRVRASTATS
jgi:cobalt-zinc-cadmium resistance protein CzcA